MSIDFVLLVLALVCFALDAFRVQTRFNLTAAGLFFFVLTAAI